jgi:hypothetical protein
MLKKASALLEALCREMEEDMLKEDDHDDHDARGGEMIKMKMEEEVEDTSSSSTLNVNGGGSSTSKELAVAQSAALMPAYQSRLSLAKMCMEVELWSEACDILDRLIAENDTVMEVWFLLGEAQLHSLDMSSAFDTVSTAAAIVSAAISSLRSSTEKHFVSVPPLQGPLFHSPLWSTMRASSTSCRTARCCHSCL